MEVRNARRVRHEVDRLARSFEPDAVAVSDVVRIWDDIDAAQRQLAAVKTLMTRRLDESKAWQRVGYRSAAEFIAAKSKTSIGAARTQLDVSQKLEQLPVVEQAVRTGGFSEPQVALVVEGSSANPAAAQRLLDQASRGSLKELRDEVLRLRAAADADPDATQRRIHSRRHFRTWRDGEGAWRASVYGTALAGARLEAALKPVIDELFAKARAEERRESRDAYAFDAVVRLAERHTAGQSEKHSPRYTTIVRADLEALRRGHVDDGEVCEIAGLGPIPVSSARELLGDSILKVVITKGVDVLNVTHLGRGPNAAQRIALLWASRGCSVEGCARTRVEIDHRIPYSKSHHTRLEELDPLCKHHHDRKTYDGWALVEGTGKRAIVPPQDPRHPKNRPKQDTS